MSGVAIIGAMLAAAAVLAAYRLGYASGHAAGQSAGYAEGKRVGVKAGSVRGYAVGFDRGKRAKSHSDDAPTAATSKSMTSLILLMVLAGTILYLATRSRRSQATFHESSVNVSPVVQHRDDP